MTLYGQFHYLTLLVFLLACHAASQRKPDSSSTKIIYESTYEVQVHHSLPKYLVHFHIENGVTPYGEPAGFYTITTCAGTNREPIDTVSYYKKDFTVDELLNIFAWAKEAEPQFVDINSDGFLDIRMLSNQGANGSLGYEYLLFDPVNKKFHQTDDY